jgi:competence protein ComEA
MLRILALAACTLPVVALATVNVNIAQQSELQRSRGLDKHKAKAIIEYRAKNGPIENFQELAKVPGFTPDVIEKAKPEIAFSGDPFVPPKKEKKAEKPAKG